MGRWLPFVLAWSCRSVTDLDPAEACRQARLAAAERVWTCTGDDEAALAADDAFSATYTCLVTGWAGDLSLASTTTSLEFVRNVSLEPGTHAGPYAPTTMPFEATLACGEALRARACDEATAPVDDGHLLLLPACFPILDAPGVDVLAGFDGDGDGSPVPDDCNDADPYVFPGAYDACADGLDLDCDDTFEYDCDRDGADQTADCDDTNPAVYPGADDPCGDFVDTDCDPVDESDCDRDGHSVLGTGDCDDHDPDVYPGAPLDECDGVDSDCNGEDCCSADGDCDGDGYDVSVDCDDLDITTYPGAPDACHDGIEQDCGTIPDFDCDQDGFLFGVGYGYDCADLDPTVNPDAQEQRYDLVDSNCNGQLDF